ncbi:histamine N-methyltransferase-like [Xenia sp. Carnegie-2017]|uniref:histamine N-methyltransferase-like n=1 Tax=Xenia sp. Carnegie-2017 TaxID=2897299 RepID=UPI001F041B97|nr:histamine N-methyltransferase-like [Xenia sp. Carnegie-2017]
MLSLHFVKSYEIFKEKCQLHSKNVTALKKHLPSHVKQSLASRHEDKEHSSFNILSVGSGTGEIDIEIANIVAKELCSNCNWENIRILNRALEPNKFSCAEYEANVSAMNENSPASYEIIPQTFSEYRKSVSNESVKFDLIHFIHSLYHVDLESAILYCMVEKLKEYGRLVCLVGDKDNITNKITKQAKNKTMMKVNDDLLTSEGLEISNEIVKFAKKYGWHYVIYSVNLQLDVTDVFFPDSVEGNLLLDFLTNTENYRCNVSALELNETLDYIKQLSVERNGRRYGEKKIHF